jgi:hypothetical protein
LVATLVFSSCSKKPGDNPASTADTPPAIPPQHTQLQLRSGEKPPAPVTQLVVLFEFEGIPQSTLNAWVGERNLRVVQRQLELNEEGLPTIEADLYVLSPRLISQFIDKKVVSAWSPEPDLALINPIFTSHPFDFKNHFALPWRWSPMVLLNHVPDPQAQANTTAVPATPAAPSFPDDPAMISMIQGNKATPDGPPLIPDPDAYRAVWEDFSGNPASTVWIPAACPLRNTSDYAKPEWKWSLPKSGTVIIFDHLLVGADSELKAEASDLMNTLLSADEQSYLLSTSGYFPVISALGKETTISPIPLPKGDWLNRSQFITFSAYDPAPPPATPSISTTEAEGETTNAGSASKEDGATPPAPISSVPASEPLPAPETTPPVQTVY